MDDRSRPTAKSQPPRLAQRNAAGFFEPPPSQQPAAQAPPAHSQIPAFRSERREYEDPRAGERRPEGERRPSGSSSVRSKSRPRENGGRMEPNGSAPMPAPYSGSGNAVDGNGKSYRSSPPRSRRPSEDVVNGDRGGGAGGRERSAYDDPRRRPSGDNALRAATTYGSDRDRERDPRLGGSSRNSPAHSRRPSGTDGLGSSGYASKAASTSVLPRTESANSAFAGRSQPGSMGSSRNGSSDAIDRDRDGRPQYRDRNYERREPTSGGARSTPDSARPARRPTEVSSNPGSAPVSASGAPAASFDDMLKALDDMQGGRKGPPSAPIPTRSSDRLAAPNSARSATTRSSREYDEKLASLDQLIGESSSAMSPTSSSASRDGDRYQRDRERDRLREREREREREKEREKDRLLREQLSGATSRSTQRSARDTPSEDASRTRSTKASWRNRGQDAAPTSASTTSPTTRTAASTQDSTAATPQPADSPRTAAAERADAREIERQRREQERVDAERKDADLREAQMIQKARTEVTAADKQLERVVAQQRVHRIDEKLVVPDYVEGVRLTLASDRNSYPEPEDFTSSDGYGLWEQNIGGTFSDVLSDMLKARFLDKRPRIEDTPEPSRSKGKQPENSYDVQLFFKVIEARGLVAKEGRTRDAYCDIEHGRIPDDGTDEARRADKGRKDRPVMQTETVRGSLNPRWDQHVNLQCDHPADKIMVSVFDRAKEQFLGRIKVSFGELIDAARRKSPVTRWYPLNGLGKKEKDKYVGGEILIEAAIKDDPNAPSQRGGSSSSSSSRPARQQDPFAQLLSQITYTTVDFRAMYKVLLRACLVLDMNMLGNSITELTVELLSPESMSMLGILGRAWGLTEAFMAMAYLELLFRRYKNAEVPQGALVGTLEGLKTSMKDDPKWLSHRERPALVTLLNEMEAYYRTQIQKYRDFFPKNTPKDALETTIMMLRMIVKHPVFRESPRNPPLTNSFQDYIKPLLTEAAIERYQQLSELCKPLDENDVEGVVEGVTKLGELISEEIDADAKYFFTAFKRELDIVRHTTEIYLKYYVLTLESTTETISSDAAVTSGSKMVFELYRQVKVMDERYAKIAPGLKRMSANTGFNVERWFAPFITRWLEHLSTKTVEWVNNAVKADQFEPLNPNDGGFSSSVTDLFSAVYQELEFIKGLEWSDPVQSAGFMQGFAKTVSKAIENYCDALAMGEIKADASTGSSWQGLLATTVGKTAQNGPKDIANVSCVKLCNIEYAMTKLHDMFRVMNVQELNRILRRHRAQVAAEAEALSASSPSSAKRAEEDDTCVSGALKVHLSYAENLQPCNKNGLANPYIILRVPDGTVVPPPETSATPAAASSTGGRTTPLSLTRSGASSPISRVSTGSSSANPPVGPTILNGIACELARSRAIPDTLAPTWDETFEVMLPPVTKLEVAVLSKNILTADDFAGNAVVNLAKGTRLRRKLADHQAHDVYVDLEPQGRVLVRLTMEGAAEDVEFWFRRSKERLGRMRDDFVRSLTARIIPYAKEEIIRVIKAQEAVPLPSKSFFSSLTTATQYSNLTAAGVPIDEPVTVRDIDDALEPLIEYLNKNLATLDVYLSERMSQEVIRRCWDEIVAVVENTLIPPLYGPVERDRRILNLRQTSASLALLNTLLEFFHAGGDGVPMEQLETRRFKHAKALVGEHVYHADVARLKKEYEHQLLKGRDRELIIRLIRVKVEKNDGTLTAQEVEETKQWIEAQLLRRKEFVRRT